MSFLIVIQFHFDLLRSIMENHLLMGLCEQRKVFSIIRAILRVSFRLHIFIDTVSDKVNDMV